MLSKLTDKFHDIMFEVEERFGWWLEHADFKRLWWHIGDHELDLCKQEKRIDSIARLVLELVAKDEVEDGRIEELEARVKHLEHVAECLWGDNK